MSTHGTAISWTHFPGTKGETWNPTTGCSRVSEGCRHCYAEQISLRFGWSKKPWTAGNAAENVILHPERLNKPLTWKSPRTVFVNSMSDLFHEPIRSRHHASVLRCTKLIEMGCRNDRYSVCELKEIAS